MVSLLLPVPGPLARLGGGGAGDQVRQVAGGGHHGPGRLGGHLDSDPAVLVCAVLDDLLLVLGVPDRLGQVPPLLRQLEVDVNICVSEVVAGGGVPAGEEAGGDHLPGKARPSVLEADNEGRVGSLSLEHVAGRDVILKGFYSSLQPDESQAHLGVILDPVPLGQADGEAVLAPGVGGRDDEITLHAPLLDLITMLFSLGENLLHLLVLKVKLLKSLSILLLLLLEFIHFNFDSFSHFRVELYGLSMISYLVDYLAKILHQLGHHLFYIHFFVLSVFLIFLKVKATFDVGKTFGFCQLEELASAIDEGRANCVLLDGVEHVLDGLDVHLGGHDWS